MTSINALRNSLDRAHQNAKSGLEDALGQVVDTGSLEDFEAYTDAARRAQLTGTVVGEELRAQHGLTKAIIDGIQ
ncbi:type III secretion protein [Pseudomonas straminea]|uniref:HrpF protein n=1 Tax=Pseudomonas straminea TaxID=47882 RepID=A0A1I1WRW4_PSEOC|nr:MULTISPECIES: type III secretion protein [Pseudomonas]TWE02949.1 HrpF protein [Pseudomonas sp. AG1028]GLX14966.1 type III secretion protein [Pseudomonas straminea]SFD97934.1 HrpF protein [Pseudomonas straminea]